MHSICPRANEMPDEGKNDARIERRNERRRKKEKEEKEEEEEGLFETVNRRLRGSRT